jgi:hypothetical protein
MMRGVTRKWPYGREVALAETRPASRRLSSAESLTCRCNKSTRKYCMPSLGSLQAAPSLVRPLTRCSAGTTVVARLYSIGYDRCHEPHLRRTFSTVRRLTDESDGSLCDFEKYSDDRSISIRTIISSASWNI